MRELSNVARREAEPSTQKRASEAEGPMIDRPLVVLQLTNHGNGMGASNAQGSELFNEEHYLPQQAKGAHNRRLLVLKRVGGSAPVHVDHHVVQQRTDRCQCGNHVGACGPFESVGAHGLLALGDHATLGHPCESALAGVVFHR